MTAMGGRVKTKISLGLDNQAPFPILPLEHLSGPRPLHLSAGDVAADRAALPGHPELHLAPERKGCLPLLLLLGCSLY